MYLPIAVQKQPQIDAVVAEVVRELTPAVQHIRCDIGQDWSGDWVLFLRVVLADGVSQGKRLKKTTARVTALIRERLRPLDLGLLVYFSFRSQSEQARVREEAWA